MNNQEIKKVEFIKGKYGNYQHPIFYIDYGYNTFVQQYFHAEELKEFIYNHLKEGYEVVIKNSK